MLKTVLFHKGRSKKAVNQDLRTKKEVIPSLVLSLSLHKLCINKYFLFSSKVLVYKNPHLCLMLTPRLVVTRRGISF